MTNGEALTQAISLCLAFTLVWLAILDLLLRIRKLEWATRAMVKWHQEHDAALAEMRRELGLPEKKSEEAK